MYEMKPEYYTGIAQIDEEHKKLLKSQMKRMNYIKMNLYRINMTTSLRF